MKNKMLIILTTGPEDRGNRATLAFSMGVSALISSVETTIYLTMSGTFWSRWKASDTVHIEGFDPLNKYISLFLENGGNLLVCSPCNSFYCSIAENTALIEGAQLCGLTHIVNVALNSTTITL